MATLAAPEPVAETAPPQRAVPQPAAPERRRAHRKRRPPQKPATARDAATPRDVGAEAYAEFVRKNAAIDEDTLADSVAAFQADFLSTKPELHADAAKRLRALNDAALIRLQRKWRSKLGGDLYPFLFDRSAKGTSPGIEASLSVLRRAFARNKAMQTEFGAVYADQRLIDLYVWQARNRFTADKFGEANADDMAALAVLRDHTPAVRAAIAATFRARYGTDLLSWLIDWVPRSEASVRAIAILRTGDDRGYHVDLASVLIPPQNRNHDLPLDHLRVPIDRRRRLEQAFNTTFTGVGPFRGVKTPDTLRGHLDKLDSSIRSRAPYHEALMLLHHDLTDAERLYVDLTAWSDTKNDSALKVARDLIKRGIGRKRLEADWDRYVRGGDAGVPAGFFTKLPLREHIRQMFKWTPTEIEGHLVALLDQLDPEDEAEVEDIKSGWGAEKDVQDQTRWAAEERRLRGADASIRATQGRIAPNDKVILDALREIAEVLHARIVRLDRRADEVRARTDLDPKERAAIAARYDAASETARSDDSKQRAALTRRIIESDDPIRISSRERAGARLALADAPTVADQVWLAGSNNNWDELVTIITKTWAQGGIDAMHRAAAKPAEDALGLEVRPAFDLFILISRMSGSLPYRRVNALSWHNVSDAKRGVARIAIEMKEGSSGSDLGPIVDLIGHHDLSPELRNKVLDAFVDYEADGGKPKARTDTSAQFFLQRMAEQFEGDTSNWERLSDLLDPPKSAAERRDRAQAIKKAGHRGRYSSVAQKAAHAWGVLSGDYLYEAEARTEDRLEFIAQASDEEIAPLLAAAGAKTRDELSQQEMATFQERHGDVQAMENTCATLIAGVVETLVEAGLAPLTGGAGFAAVIAAAVASMASMAAQEAMLGPDYKLISGENLNTVLQSALGTATTELDLRSYVLKAFPLESLAKHQRLQQTIQNQITGVLELTASSVAEITTNILAREKWPTNEDIAKQADLMIGRMIAKAFSTQVTVDYHPGKYRSYMEFADRLKTNALFKLSIKVTEAAAKEIVSIAVNGVPDQTLAEQVMQVLWKETRGFVSTGTRIVTSTVGGAGTAYGGRGLVDTMRQQHPDLFPPLLRSVLTDHYHADSKLKDELAGYHRAGRKITVDQFMLEKLQQTDKPGRTDAAKLQSKVEKELLTYAELMTGRQKGTPGVLAYLQPSAGIQAIGAAESEAPRPDPALAAIGSGWNIRRLRVAEETHLARKNGEQAAWDEQRRRANAPLRERLAEIKRTRERLPHEPGEASAHAAAPAAHPPPAVTPLSKLRIHALMKEHAALDPAAHEERARVVTKVLDGDTPFARGVLAGDRAHLLQFLHEHGDWGQAIQILQTLGAGPEAASVGLRDHTRALEAERNAVAAHLRKAYGAEASPHASTKVTSDLDLAIKGANAPQRRRDAEAYMFKLSGKDWRTIWNVSFFGEGTHLTRYADYAHLVPKEERSATQLRLTNLTEHYAFTRMLYVAQKSGRKDVEAFVEKLAGSLGHDLTVARADATKLTPANARSRRHTLEADIEKAAQELDGAANDPAVTPEHRFQLATRLAEMTMEANFLTKEANIGPGANRALLQGVEVKGPEAYQAFLNHALMYVEHTVEPGSHLTYAPPKYISRMVGTLDSAGFADGMLRVQGQVAAHVYKNDRHVNSKGGPRRGDQAPNPQQDVIAQQAAFEAAVLGPAAKLKTNALAKLDVIAAAPAPGAKAQPSLPDAARPQAPMRPAAITAPTKPPRFHSDRHFFGTLKKSLEDGGSDLAGTLAKRSATLDLPTTGRWIAYLVEQAATHPADRRMRDDLVTMNAVFARLSPAPAGQ